MRRYFYIAKASGSRPFKVLNHKPEPKQYVSGPYRTHHEATEAMLLRERNVDYRRNVTWCLAGAAIALIVIAIIGG